MSDNNREGGIKPETAENYEKSFRNNLVKTVLKNLKGRDVFYRRERTEMLTPISIGEKYGRFTVIAEAKRDRFGNRRFRCRCECGNEADYSVSVIVGKPNRFCRKCVPHSGGLPKPDIVGQQINGWDILEESGTNKYGAYLFKCRCMRCGNISIKTVGQIRRHKTDRCDQCPPMYNFQVTGTTATGILPNGDAFIIDADDIPLVEKYYWGDDSKDGYVVASRSGKRLHRLIAGVNDPKVMVDHINRNRKDCRRSNLRVISTFGNSCNHSHFITNKTGYTGVYYSKHSGRYEVKVGYDHKRIKLGSSLNDLITLAQMYNIGAQFFFGEYVGELNDVPPPSEELIQCVIAKCQKYKEAPAKNAGASVA